MNERTHHPRRRQRKKERKKERKKGSEVCSIALWVDGWMDGWMSMCRGVEEGNCICAASVVVSKSELDKLGEILGLLHTYVTAFHFIAFHCWGSIDVRGCRPSVRVMGVETRI